MIGTFIQPDVLEIDEKLRLVKYYPDYDFNAQSRTCFTSVGFRQVGREQFNMEL